MSFGGSFIRQRLLYNQLVSNSSLLTFAVLFTISIVVIMSFSSRFRERWAWLSRMPLHYRILFGGQACFMVVAFQYRQQLIAKRRGELEMLEAGERD